MLDWLHVGDHVLQKQERPVVDPRQSRAEPPGETLGVMLIPDGTFDLLPLNPERRIGQQVVEPLANESVFRERVAQHYVGGVLALEHHVGTADGVRLGIQLLTEYLQPGLRMQRAQMVLGDAEHAAGATSRIEHGLDHARLGEQLVIFDEQQVDHQPDHLARSEVLTCRLVGKLGESTDQLLVEVAHLQIGDIVGVQIDVAEPRDNQIKQIRPVQAVDLGQ